MEFEISLHAIKPCQATSCNAPERLNAVDMNRFFQGVWISDAKMLVVPNVHQAIAALPAFGMDNAPGRNPAPYDGLKRPSRAVPVTGSA